MKKVIHKLRQKPEDEKRHILHILTFFGAVILVIAWSFSLGHRLGSEETRAGFQKDIEPFNNLSKSITETGQDFVNINQ